MSDTPETEGLATLDVRRRLEQLRTWKQEWEIEDTRLVQRLRQLNPRDRIDMQRGVQIACERRRERFRLVQLPIEISEQLVSELGYETLRQHFAEQFARLTTEERLLWLNNLYFVMTPDLRALLNKIAKVRSDRSTGRPRNFLLGGHSGMGKTTSLDWLLWTHKATVEQERNHVPIVRFDAPVSNRSARALFQRAILGCGTNYDTREGEESLLDKLVFLLGACGVELLCIDEIEHLVSHYLRRHLLEISNLSSGVCIICASCRPFKFTENDTEIAGRWNDQFDLELYVGSRLDQLLSFIELLLPFTRPSLLALRTIGNGSGAPDGPAKLIEAWTHGALRDIMILLISASVRAIQANSTHLTVDALAAAHRGICTRELPGIAGLLGLPMEVKP